MAREESRGTGLLDSAVRRECLLTDTSPDLLETFAPFVLALESQEQRKNLLGTTWGNSLGIFARSHYGLTELTLHFKKLVLVRTEEEEELYFRFYDPRILRTFLPLCDSAQLKEFFGPVEWFLCENEDTASGSFFFLEKNLLKEKQVAYENCLAGIEDQPAFYAKN